MTFKPFSSEPLPAATLCLMRAHSTPEVLLLRRRTGGVFSGAHVFPGGVVDAEDETVTALAASAELRIEKLARRFKQSPSPQSHYVAAIRETFEEAGILFAYAQDGQFLGDEAGVLAQEREALIKGERSFAELVIEHNLTLAVDRLTYMGRKVTPTFAPKRFDTHFFLARATRAMQATPCNAEMKDSAWVSPATALAGAGERYELLYPTRKYLEALSAFESPESAFAHYRSEWAI